MPIKTHLVWGVAGDVKPAVGVVTKLCDGSPDDALVKALTIKAKVANTGKVWIGGEDVADSISLDGLAAGQVLAVQLDGLVNLSHIYAYVTETGDGVDFYGNSL